MNVDLMVMRWSNLIVKLALAHDKEAADRIEATVEDCLNPILSAPVKQLREFGAKLLGVLKADPAVPYVLWRSYEVWIHKLKDAPDEEVKTLKKDLAAEIVDLIEDDIHPQLPEAMVRALMWRSPEKLEEMKAVVTQEKAKGNKVRLRGRESCLFIEAGGSEDEPKVCVQL